MSLPIYAIGILLLMLASPLALAKPDCETNPDRPSCKDGGDTLELAYSVAILSHDNIPAPDSPLYQPYDLDNSCLAQAHDHRAQSNGLFPYDDGNWCEELTTDLGDTIKEIVGFHITKDKKSGAIVSATIQGLDSLDYTTALYRVSDEMVDPDVEVEVETFADESFIIHLHADNVMLYKCDTNWLQKKSVCEIPTGTFAIEDFYYIPYP